MAASNQRRQKACILPSRAHPVRLESAERDVPVATTIASARIPDLTEPQAAPSNRESLHDARQRRQQPVDLIRSAHGDAQIVGDARGIEMADDDRAPAERDRQRRAVMRRVVREDEIGEGWQDFEAKPAQSLAQPLSPPRMRVP